MGKNIRQSRLEVQGVAELFRYHAGWASKLDGAVRQVPGGFHCYVTLEPVGVVTAITPFNVPLYLTATKAAPALAAGNVFIHKPSDNASISALRMAEMIEQAGVPEGVYSVITGNGRELGQAISAHRGIDKIAFTGSTRTGIDIIQRSTPTLKKVTMELGGKSPHIICADADADADLERAAQMALIGNFLNSGQICTSGSRLIVEVGVASMGTAMRLDIDSMLLGRTVVGRTEGDAVPDLFIPRLVHLHASGALPLEKITRVYDFADINQAVKDSESGQTIKAVLRIGQI